MVRAGASSSFCLLAYKQDKDELLKIKRTLNDIRDLTGAEIPKPDWM
jgi:hypothetical protein